MDSMSAETEGEWNKQLQAFVESLKPSQDDVKIINLLADFIFRILQEKQTKYKIDRRVLGGSLGKKTAVSGGDIGFDVDLVVMVNHQQKYKDTIKKISVKDLPDVLNCFRETLNKNVTTCRIQGYGGVDLRTEICDFDFDIVPAINFSQNEDEQNKRVWEEMKIIKPITDRYRLSSSLVYAYLNFFESQSTFVHDVIRLCKFWNKRCTVREYISGRSSLFELIAVDVANKVKMNAVELEEIAVKLGKIADDIKKNAVDLKKKVEKNAVDVKKNAVDVKEKIEKNAVDVKNKIEKNADDIANEVKNLQLRSLYKAFRQFLEALKDFDNMNINFVVDEVKKDFSPGKVILKQRPLVLDPCNPFNNIAKGLSANARKIFAGKADEDLKSLYNLKDEVNLPRVKLKCTTATLAGGESVRSYQFKKQPIESELIPSDSIQIRFKKTIDQSVSTKKKSRK